MAPNGTAHRFDALPLLKRSMTICDKKMYTFTQSHSCTHTHKSNGSSLKCHWVALQQTMTNSVSLFSIWLSFFFSQQSWVVYCLLFIDFLVWLFAVVWFKNAERFFTDAVQIVPFFVLCKTCTKTHTERSCNGHMSQ